MSQSDHKPGAEQRLVEAYNKMLARVRQRMDELEKDARPMLHNAMENAKETATELGELTRDEAEAVAKYLRRDLEAAGEFISRSGRDLGTWLQFDAELVETTVAERFLQVADQTRVELDRLSLTAEALGEWHTGEITGIGTLECKSCGEKLHFRNTGHIPPCPKCHGSTFRRVTGEE